jgi:hypothetical protein
MNSKILMASAAAALAMSFSAGSARALIAVPTDVFFTITSDTEPTITFELPLSPNPFSSDPGADFDVGSIPITVGGVSGYSDDFTFWSATYGGGLSESDGYFGSLGIYAAQLYSGSESSPTFLLGIYPGTYGEEDPGATIEISGTPLPSTWTMLIAGFVGLGFLSFRGKKSAAALAAA